VGNLLQNEAKFSCPSNIEFGILCEGKCKVNVTLSLCTTWWHVEVEAHLHSLLTWALVGGEWSASRSGRHISGTYWVGRRSRLVVLRQKRKNVSRKGVSFGFGPLLPCLVWKVDCMCNEALLRLS
jgi:hypothetical protein